MDKDPENDQDRVLRRSRLLAVKAHVGWTMDMLPHIHAQMRKGWEDFIKMPVDKKTNKEAYNCQARYQVFKEFLGWMEEEIRSGEQSAKELDRKQ